MDRPVATSPNNDGRSRPASLRFSPHLEGPRGIILAVRMGFSADTGVEPTNNTAERALRTAVQWRKIMFGNRSADGELAVARLLTVTSTCQLQQLKCSRVSDRRDSVPSPPSSRRVTAGETAHPLNCYRELLRRRCR